jgi:hypothetical protein
MSTPFIEQEWPLTCELCQNAPATQLLVVEWPVGMDRGKHLVCTECDGPSPGQVTRLRLHYVRYDLQLVDFGGPDRPKGARS